LIAYDRRVPDDRADSLRSILDRTYDAPDHPALIQQTEKWRTAKPFAGMHVVDASPVFGNTLAKYVPLLAGGADLTVSLSPLLPHDRETVGLLGQVGIPVVTGDSSTEYDVVLDCAGALAETPSRTGYVELTKSGERVYESSRHPVFLADDSRVKHIETTLGTGDGSEAAADRTGQGSSGSLTGMTTSFLRRNHGVHGGSKRA
jgi:adenosylhomocysteinase